MHRKTGAGLTVGLMTLGVFALTAPSAQAASKHAHVELGNRCYADVYVTNDNTAGRIKGFFGVFCRNGGELWVTPGIRLTKGGSFVKRGSPGIRSINKNKGVNFSLFTNNSSGKQCYKAHLQVQIIAPNGETASTKVANTACLKV
ncbi:hypothetical protein GCM10010307_27050 [Streptomyces vastus]|uniref:Spore-associated protein A n=2 Tax=Streptomyces vastus TaxID=285451 RepID=A0ABP6D1I5_9ACTN